MLGPSLLGYRASLFGTHVDTSAPRGRTLDGGTIWFLGIKVRRGDSSGEGRAAHGPLHPAVDRSLETCTVPFFVFLSRSWSLSLVVCLAFLSLGLVFVMDFKPFKPRPVFGFLYVSLFFSCIWLVSSTPCFLFLFLRRWGNPNLFGLGFPLCFFDLYADYDYDPYFFLITYTQASPGPCFFFFLSSPSLVFRFGCFSVLVLVVLGVFVGAIVSEDFEGSRPCCCIAVTRCIMHGFGVGKGEED